MFVSKRRRGAGFTLIELLVVVSIIALLISILLPSLRKARNQAKDTVCMSNMHQLGVMLHYYLADNGERLPWILGTDVGSGMPNNAPFHQYYQLFYNLPYYQDLALFHCPRVESAEKFNLGWGAAPLPGKAPGSTRNYLQGNGGISYYTVLSSNTMFVKLWLQRTWPSIQPMGATVPELYTEYWYNDWSEGAGNIPAISGNLINRIPFPDYAVVMSDAVQWNPRHGQRNSNFLFLDGHVSPIAAEQYFDPEGQRSTDPTYESRDRDGFANRPYWAWGLGKNIRGY